VNRVRTNVPRTSKSGSLQAPRWRHEVENVTAVPTSQVVPDGTGDIDYEARHGLRAEGREVLELPHPFVARPALGTGEAVGEGDTLSRLSVHGLDANRERRGRGQVSVSARMARAVVVGRGTLNPCQMSTTDNRNP
jgi:hypothetical protein